MGRHDDAYYQAMLARDPRFDGKFFVGVKTTGIYCRPICPAKPQRKNVEFFPDASAAEKAGYRPCLRCRPESAPDSPTWIGKSAVVRRGLRLISENRFMDLGDEKFAALLGVSARHLRRLFESEVGKTPKQLADDQRLGFARKLIVETRLPLTEVAFSAGFESIRRFNGAFQKRFRRRPSDLRKKTSAADPEAGVQMNLHYRPPLDWESLLLFYQSHRIPGVEEVSSTHYARLFEFDGKVGSFSVVHHPEKSALGLEVQTEDHHPLFEVVTRARKMFDLDADPLRIIQAFSGCEFLTGLVVRDPGLRIPRGWDPFEVSVATILGQLVSTEQASRLLGQLVDQYGKKVKNPPRVALSHLFPVPEVLARATFSELGTTAARKSALREFSIRLLENKLSLSSAQDPTAFRQSLQEIKGIGPWTAEYISLRALGDVDAFPSTDLILKRALALHPTIRLEAIQPWRAYAAFYLWKNFAKRPEKPIHVFV